ncbi:MAG: tetratricopeptide repeat protein [Proteobacteria bacterium]|nr:tetratricopeptide repeat protein [Pseudomonadota bacterium]
MNEGLKSRAGIVAAGVGALLLIGWAYSNHFDNGFQFDDFHVIEDNAAIRSLRDVPSFFRDPLTYSARPQNASYRPLLTLSYALDYARADGLKPAFFHETQFLLHLTVWIALLALYRKLLDLCDISSWHPWIALFSATFFAVHTANTETVNYLSARSSLVATLAVVCSLLVYLQWPKLRRWQLHLVPMLVGGLAKPLTVMYAPLLLVMVLLLEERRAVGGWLKRDTWNRRVAASVGPAFAGAALLYVLVRAMEPDTMVYSTIDRLTYARTQPYVWLRLFFLPVGLTADTDLGFLTSWSDARVLGGVLGLLLLGGTIWRLSAYPWARPAAFGLCWFALALIPTSSVVPLSEPYNEHRIYFPYAGLALAFGWAGAAILQRQGNAVVAALAAMALLSVHATGTQARNRVWHSDASLWADVVAKSPRNGRALMNYGLTKMRTGKFEEALRLFERAQTFRPDYGILEINLAICKSALGRRSEIEAHFRRALELDSGYARGHFFYGRWLFQQGRAAEAETHLNRALALAPNDLAPVHLLMYVLAARGEHRRLQELVAQTRAHYPEDPVVRRFGVPRGEPNASRSVP